MDWTRVAAQRHLRAVGEEGGVGEGLDVGGGGGGGPVALSIERYTSTITTGLYY